MRQKLDHCLRNQQVLRAGLYFVLTGLYILPVWSTVILPMMDLHNHLGMAHVIHTYRTNPLYQEYFAFSAFPMSNILFHYLTHFLAYLLPIETAGKVVVSLYIAALPASILYLLGAFRRNQWLFVLTYPFIYNYPMAMGFIAFSLSLPLFFFGLGVTYRFLQTPSLRYGLRAFGLASLLFLAHGQTYLYFGLSVAVMGTYLLFFSSPMAYLRKAGWTKVLKHFSLICLPYLGSLVFFIPWFWRTFIAVSPKLQPWGFTAEKYFGAKYDPFAYHLSHFPDYIIGYFSDNLDKTLVLILILLVLLLVSFSNRKTKAIFQSAASNLLLLLTGLTVLTYILLPMHIKNQAFISCRQSIFLPFLIIGLLEANLKQLKSGLTGLLILGLIIFQSFYIRSNFQKFNVESRSFNQLLKKVPAGKKLMDGLFDEGSRSIKQAQYRHVNHYYYLRNQGITDYSFARHAGHPLRLKKVMPEVFLYRLSQFANPDIDYYDYLLIRDPHRRRFDKMYVKFIFMEAVGPWALYQIRQPAGLPIKR